MKKLFFSIASVAVLFLVSAHLVYQARFESASRSPSSQAKHKKVIFIGVDGFGRKEFDYVHKHGMFKNFKSVSTHIAPFPVISDYSWNILTGAQEVYGQAGRIRSYEGTFYNSEKNYLVDDSREYFRRLGQDNLYFAGAFQHYFNPYLEALMYFPTEKIPEMEISQLKTAIIESQDKPFVSAMVASVDALAHTRKDVLGMIQKLDEMVTEVEQHFKKQGIDTEIIITSDHGQGARFEVDQKPVLLIPVDVKKTISETGLKIVKKLENPDDVVVPLMALVSYSSVYFKDLSKREVLIAKLREQKWFEMSIHLEKREKNLFRVKIYDSNGFAYLTFGVHNNNTFSYKYLPQTSNPLLLNEEYFNKQFHDSEIDLMQEHYPDSFFRIAQTVLQSEADMGDLIFTLRPDFRLSGDFDKFTQMYRTHGSMLKDSSSGILMSNHPSRVLPPFVRTKDILAAAGLRPKQLFERDVPSQEGKDLPTGRDDLSNERIFKLINRMVNYSQYVLDIPTIDSLAGLFPDKKISKKEDLLGKLEKSKIEIQNKFDPADVGLLTDMVLELGSMEKIEADPRFKKLKLKYLGKSRKTPDVRQHTVAAKRVVMKSYGSMFLLENALNLPEFETVTDTRNPAWKKSWDTFYKTSLEEVPTTFAEIFKEQSLQEDLYPEKIKLYYGEKNNAKKNLTIVYVPGIYSSIFDGEIFQMGLDSLTNDLGVRVITAPVFSACSSRYNGKIILDFIKEDMSYLKARGRSEQDYLILGYSKGGVDSLSALLLDKKFTREKILGLVTIASPLHGSSILNKTDVPLEILKHLADQKIPEVCLEKEKASASITPDGAAAFLQDNLKDLIGLTRYYSISFVSDVKNSHLFMKATKQIARFNEQNDGVVTLSSSKFPDEVKALDFGVVSADHLAGITASYFPQRAFIKSIYQMLLELNAFNKNSNFDYNHKASIESPFNKVADYRMKLKSSLLQENKAFSEFYDDYNKELTTYSDKELTELEEKLKSSLGGTPFSLKDFNLVKKDNKVFVSYSAPVSDNKYLSWFTMSEKLPVRDFGHLVLVLMEKFQKNGKNLLEENVELWRTYPVSGRKKFVLPANDLGFMIDFKINVRKLMDFVGGKRVLPMSKSDYPEGLSIIYDHPRSQDFRAEYQFSYEESAPVGADDSKTDGWSTMLIPQNSLQAILRSKGTSVRLSTYSWKFMLKDFPEMTLDYQVNNDVAGADPFKPGSGKDDAAFQVWFTLREITPTVDPEKLSKNDNLKLVGYHFGDEQSGRKLEDGKFYENYYSEKDYFIAVLPEARQLLLSHGKDKLGIAQVVKRNLLEDMKVAFPKNDPSKWQIVNITFQHDSNDTKGDSEAIFRSLKFTTGQH